MDILFDLVGTAWDFINRAWFVLFFCILFVLAPISVLWERNKKLAIGVVSLAVVLAIIFIPKYYESKQIDMYLDDLAEIVTRTSTYGVEFDDAYSRFENGNMSSKQIVTLIDKFIVTMELNIDDIRELKTPSEFETFSALQIQLNLRGIEMYQKMSDEITKNSSIDYKNYYDEYAEIEQSANEINIELVNLQKKGLVSSE